MEVAAAPQLAVAPAAAQPSSASSVIDVFPPPPQRSGDTDMHPPAVKRVKRGILRWTIDSKTYYLATAQKISGAQGSEAELLYDVGTLSSSQ